MTKVDLKTVVRVLQNVGDMAIEYLNSFSGLSPSRIEADELTWWLGGERPAWKKKKGEDETAKDNQPFDPEGFDDVDLTAGRRNGGRKGKGPPVHGRLWTYVALDPQSNFVLACESGSRNRPNTDRFAKKLARTLARDSEGELLVKPSLVTDGMPAYGGAFERAFHAEINYAQYVKRREKQKSGRWKFVGADRRRVVGNMPEELINTTYVERQNLNIRMGNRRFTRKSNAFSKRMKEHERSVALWVLFHNFCWVQRPKRPPPGSPKGTLWRKVGTAASQIGVANRHWEVSDIVDLLDNYLERIKAETANDNEPVEEESCVVTDVDVQLVPSHWVYVNHLQGTAKVHKAECSNCRDGQGKHGGSKPGTAEWRPFFSLDAAKDAAADAAPGDDSICSMCIGSYNWQGHYKPNRKS